MTKFCCFSIQQVTWWIFCCVFAYPNLPASLKVWNYLICISQTNRWKTITTSGSLILQMWCVHFETRSMTPQFLQWLEPVKSDDLPNYYRIRMRTSENYSLRVNWAMLGSWATTLVVDIIMKCILFYAVWIVYVLLFSNPPFRVRSLFLFVIQNEEVLPTLFHVPFTYHALRHSCIWVGSDSHDSKFTIKRFTAPHQLFRGCCWVSYGQQYSIDWIVVSMTGSTMFHQPAKLDVHKPKNQLSFFEPACSAFFC